MEPARTVAVFCNTFLPYSQTFVWDELRAHERYRVEVFAWKRRNETLFPGPVHVARPWYPLTRRSRTFEKRFTTGDIALVHAHFGWAGVPAAGFAQRHKVPLVVSFHGYDVALLAGRGFGPPAVWPYTLHAQHMLESMHLGLCASGELLEMLVAAGVPRERLVEHRLGVDLERFAAAARDPLQLRVAMVGRFVAKKGFADGIRAFASAAREIGESASLAIAGSGPLEKNLRDLVRSLDIEARVRFLGALPHAAVAELLSHSDILLAPSAVASDGDRDSGLMSVKEASASECIPIATRHGGIPSIIDDGVTGYLVAEHDIATLAGHLVALARNADARRAMGRAAREKMARQFELRSSVRELESYYDETIRRHTPSERLSVGIEVSRPSSQ